MNNTAAAGLQSDHTSSAESCDDDEDDDGFFELACRHEHHQARPSSELDMFLNDKSREVASQTLRLHSKSLLSNAPIECLLSTGGQRMTP